MITLNGEVLSFSTFPNGETKVDGHQILSFIREKEEVTLTLKYESDGDLLKLLFVKDFLDNHVNRVSLEIMYMPYSRMDRAENTTDVFTLKSVARFINQMDFTSVLIIEPHSDVTPALIDRSRVTYPTLSFLETVLDAIRFDKDRDYIYFPDAGAAKRYGKGKEIKKIMQLVGHKSRNWETGELDKLDVVGDIQKDGFKVLIIDDLCSYGGTFRWGAAKLREKGASEVYLLVTHCENSIYEKGLLHSGLITEVFTTNTIMEKSNHEKLIVYKLI
ncbi:ribose-phosphate pyrophosphokinase (plasmid) [Paenibacillus thiaminolyticus]|uniref:ribose-phosphate pyrophosphokinase n=1 Tax=Paenibacillus thiaminolyticus TaxID=49283 RepID=UPI00232EC4C5|nr:ribose-phosphate pyrophosphokinase [Paenibacillus thiaminolyticus]WCF11706.1 ribose-phosphate pyrophosphokinase [Paenibacillus thiaminolyticus]